jgi:hypothetical protein
LAGKDPTVVLIVCITALGLGRVVAMLTSSLMVVYIVMAALIIALGVMDAVESTAGLLGPTLGGILSRLGKFIPLFSVVSLYAAVLIAVLLFFRITIVEETKPFKTKADKQD